MTKTDRELLEELHRDLHTHVALHQVEKAATDKEIKGLKTTVYGNGRPGLKTQVYLLMWVLAIVTMILAPVATKVFGQ